FAREQARGARRIDTWIDQIKRSDASSGARRGLIAVATNGQTYFMRDTAQLAALAGWMTSHARSLNRPLYVWSAGFSTGEESSSVSMWGLTLVLAVRVVGSDLNFQSLEHARRGVYAEWALRNVEPAERAAFFKRAGQAFEVTERVREQVTFVSQNLAS